MRAFDSFETLVMTTRMRSPCSMFRRANAVNAAGWIPGFTDRQSCCVFLRSKRFTKTFTIADAVVYWSNIRATASGLSEKGCLAVCAAMRPRASIGIGQKRARRLRIFNAALARFFVDNSARIIGRSNDEFRPDNSRPFPESNPGSSRRGLFLAARHGSFPRSILRAVASCSAEGFLCFARWWAH